MSREPEDIWDSEPWEPSPFEGAAREEWDEADWEEYLAQQDILHAKYDELFETLSDHPDRDGVIAAEMHWNLPEELGFECGESCCDECLDGEDLGPPCEHVSDELGSIPAFRLAQDYVLDVERALAARIPDLDEDEDAGRTVCAAGEAADRIAVGHGIGYDRESLCGNIAYCRRALASLAECLEGLRACRKRGVLSPREADQFLGRGQRVSEAISQRIEELRSSVWWR